MRTIYKYIITGLVIVLASSSCTKDWLDVTADSQVRAEDQFKSEGGFKDALIGVYIGMTDRALYSKELTWNLVDLLSQQYSPFTSPNALYTDIQQFNYTSIRASSQIDQIWTKAYNVIGNINNALFYIDKNKGVLQPINYSIIKGELLGLRAFIHLDLMRLYGYGNIAARNDLSGKLAIPYVTEFSKDMTPQRSYAETFGMMSKDINEALELLKEDPLYPNSSRPATYYNLVNRDGFYNKREQRMNYYAVRALQARMLLWQGGAENIANARAAAEDVIVHSPARLITSTFDAARDPSLYPEHLFNLNIAAFADIINNFLNVDDATSYNSVFLSGTFAESLYESGNVNIGLADLRFNTLFQSGTRGKASIKFKQFTNRGGANTMTLIKLPEMYYIAAEYYLTTPDLQKAIEYLNAVRSSRGIIQTIPSTASQTVVADELFKEYRKEFVSEGQLFFYYKRTGRTAFPGLAATRIADDKIYLLPYPDSEIEFGNRVQ